MAVQAGAASCCRPACAAPSRAGSRRTARQPGRPVALTTTGQPVGGDAGYQQRGAGQTAGPAPATPNGATRASSRRRRRPLAGPDRTARRLHGMRRAPAAPIDPRASTVPTVRCRRPAGRPARRPRSGRPPGSRAARLGRSTRAHAPPAPSPTEPTANSSRPSSRARLQIDARWAWTARPRPNGQPAAAESRPAPPTLQPPAAASRGGPGAGRAPRPPGHLPARDPAQLLLPLLDRITGTCGLRPGPRWPPPGPATTTCRAAGVGCTAPCRPPALEERPDGTVELARRPPRPCCTRGRRRRGRPGRRRLAFQCLDATEGAPHLAGALGDAVAAALLADGWVERTPGSRAVQLTPAGPAACGGAQPNPRARAGQPTARELTRNSAAVVPAPSARPQLTIRPGGCGGTPRRSWEAGVDRAAAGGQGLARPRTSMARARRVAEDVVEQERHLRLAWASRHFLWPRSRPRRRRWCPPRR